MAKRRKSKPVKINLPEPQSKKQRKTQSRTISALEIEGMKKGLRGEKLASFVRNEMVKREKGKKKKR